MWALRDQRMWRGEGGGTLTLSVDSEGRETGKHIRETLLNGI